MCALCSSDPMERKAAVEADRELAKRLRAFAVHLEEQTTRPVRELHQRETGGLTWRERAHGLVRDLVAGWL